MIHRLDVCGGIAGAAREDLAPAARECRGLFPPRGRLDEVEIYERALTPAEIAGRLHR